MSRVPWIAIAVLLMVLLTIGLAMQRVRAAGMPGDWVGEPTDDDPVRVVFLRHPDGLMQVCAGRFSAPLNCIPFAPPPLGCWVDERGKPMRCKEI